MWDTEDAWPDLLARCNAVREEKEGRGADRLPAVRRWRTLEALPEEAAEKRDKYER